MNACRLIDPQRIVLGGASAALYPLVSARVATHMEGSKGLSFPIPEIFHRHCPRAWLGFGAACLLHQHWMSLANEEFLAHHGHAEMTVKTCVPHNRLNESHLP